MYFLFFDDFILTAIILLSILFIFKFLSVPRDPPASAASSSSSSLSDSASDSRRRARLEAGNFDCSICLDQCIFAVETNCNHAFCAPCWLELSSHSHSSLTSSSGHVKCPNDRRGVSLLIELWTPAERALLSEPFQVARGQFDRDRPSAAFAHQFYNGIRDYNRRAQIASATSAPLNFRSMADAFRDAPSLLRALSAEATSSIGGLMSVVLRLKIVISFLLGFLYVLLPIDFMPEILFGVVGYLDDILVVLFIAVYISQIFRGVIVERQEEQARRYEQRRQQQNNQQPN